MPRLATLYAVVRSSSVSLRLSLILVATLCAGCPEGDDGAAKPSSDAVIDAGAKKQGKHANQKPEEIEYEGTIAGLERLMRDLRTGITNNDQPEITVLLASLRMEDDEPWLKKTFGDKLGAQLSKEYKPHKEEIGVLSKHLEQHFDEGLTKIQVERYQTAEVDSSTGYQNAAIKLMKESVPLYSVRFVSKDGKSSFHLWSFVHHEGSFRYIGKLRGVAKERTLGDRDLNEYRLSDAERLVAQGK